MKINHKIFGKLDLGQDDPIIWDGTIKYDGRVLETKMVIDYPEEVNEKTIKKYGEFLTKISDFDKIARQHIQKNSKLPKSAVRVYIKDHLSESGKKEFASLIGSIDDSKLDLESFFSKLELNDIALYPNKAWPHICYNYGMIDEFSHYILTVNLKENGDLHSIGIET